MEKRDSVVEADDVIQLSRTGSQKSANKVGEAQLPETIMNQNNQIDHRVALGLYVG